MNSVKGPKREFYRRILPETCTAFSSEEGKRLFKESLLSGYANIYFPLAEQFCTQSEPAYCGLSTLVMVLNALSVDPKKIWKGSWRWYHEEMLDCCVPLDLIQQDGITMEQFTCLAVCNNLDLNVTRMNEEHEIECFRETVKKLCAGEEKVLVCSYSRGILKQTGDGHFSPIGAYHPREDKILIFDVARFKYPPHWITVGQMWDSMKATDKTTGLPRGYIIMTKAKESPLILFRLSNTFRVTIGTHKIHMSNMTKFLVSWKKFFESTTAKFDGNEFSNLKGMLTFALSALNESLASLMEGESVFTTQFNTCCKEALPKQHLENVWKLLRCIEQTDIYKYTDEWVEKFKRNNLLSNIEDSVFECDNPNSENCNKPNCCRIHRIGKSVAEKVKMKRHLSIDSNGTTKETNGHSDIESSAIKQCAHKQTCTHKKIGSLPQIQTKSFSYSDEDLVTDSHYLTMLLLCWPYEIEQSTEYVSTLKARVQEWLENCDEILSNEVKQLRQQILSLLSLISLHCDH